MPSLPTFLRPSLAARCLRVRLALFALLVAALVPTFSRLMLPAGLADAAFLCQAAQADGAPRAGSTPDAHAPGDACALCSLSHTTPALGGSTLPAVVVVAYAPPSPPAPAAVRARIAQSRAPGARAPPPLA
jgi:hypothetical protein